MHPVLSRLNVTVSVAEVVQQDVVRSDDEGLSAYSATESVSIVLFVVLPSHTCRLAIRAIGERREPMFLKFIGTAVDCRRSKCYEEYAPSVQVGGLECYVSCGSDDWLVEEENHVEVH